MILLLFSIILWLQVHTKKRNRLEHARLNKLVYVSYNRRMTFRFQKIRELGSKGKRSNPLLLEEFQWENEWVDINCEALWEHVDDAVGATDQLRARNMPREAAVRARNNVTRTYGRNKKRKTSSPAESSVHEEEEDRVAEEEAQGASGAETDEEMEDQGQQGEEDSGGPATNDGNEEFQVDADLLL
jgi:hypothetical protein